MATAKSKRVAPVRAATQYIHESDDRSGNHRIVRVEGGKTIVGDWTPPGVVAVLDGVRAATAQFAGGLPSGVFRAVPVDHVTL